jgi:hypothetical protein
MGRILELGIWRGGGFPRRHYICPLNRIQSASRLPASVFCLLPADIPYRRVRNPAEQKISGEEGRFWRYQLLIRWPVAGGNNYYLLGGGLSPEQNVQCSLVVGWP